MKNKYTVIVISLLFLLPGISHAASVDEQRTVILNQIIHLLEQQIAELQSQLAVQQKFGSVRTITATTTEATTTTCTYEKSSSGHLVKECGG